MEDEWFIQGGFKRVDSVILKNDNLEFENVVEKIEIQEQEKKQTKALKPLNAFEVIYLMVSPSEIKKENKFLIKGDFATVTEKFTKIFTEMKSKKTEIKGNLMKVFFGKDTDIIMVHVDVIPFKSDLCYVTVKRASGNSLLFVEIIKTFLKQIKGEKLNV
jgi:hypothetical protein